MKKQFIMILHNLHRQMKSVKNFNMNEEEAHKRLHPPLGEELSAADGFWERQSPFFSGCGLAPVDAL